MTSTYIAKNLAKTLLLRFEINHRILQQIFVHVKMLIIK